MVSADSSTSFNVTVSINTESRGERKTLCYKYENNILSLSTMNSEGPEYIDKDDECAECGQVFGQEYFELDCVYTKTNAYCPHCGAPLFDIAIQDSIIYINMEE